VNVEPEKRIDGGAHALLQPLRQSAKNARCAKAFN
jgi:hypothetical protein